MSEGYEAFAERLAGSGVLSDPWLEGRPRFRAAPVVVDAAGRDELYRAAEAVTAAYDEACRLCAREPALLDGFLALTPYQKLLWEASRPLWHGVARADVFRTAEGLRVCELNCDTPTGEAEATVLGRLALEGAPAGALDPNEGLGERLCAMVEALAGRLLEPGRAPSIGLVYPTEMSEDLALVRLYRGWFEARGWPVTLGSPYNLRAGEGGAVCLFDEPCSIVWRHYKTDWWAERAPVWDDAEPFADPAPLAGPLAALLGASLAGRCVVVHPFGAVLPQNKRSMALMWELLDRFSPASQRAIRDYIPYTVRLEALHAAQLAAEREAWVLKTDYGAEGDEVIVGRLVADDVWRASLAHAVPGRWVAQRYFAAEEDPAGASVNHGVFVVAGEACGLYARVQRGPTDAAAESAPVLVADGTVAAALAPARAAGPS
ncbi:MAG TPA: glutathionylspermidine synthase family protein [Polyangiaceae bacterium]|nr:glutathionylspermidine synthase family protein [Polyangiaceae bacterium]